MTKVKIVSTGSYLPPKIVTDDVFDERFNLEKGTTLRKSGVKNRHYVENESQVDMAVKAINEALKNTDNKNIDCIVFAGGVPQQLIPCTASLIQQALGRTFDSIPCFDINSTCLSFVTAFNVISAGSSPSASARTVSWPFFRAAAITSSFPENRRRQSVL